MKLKRFFRHLLGFIYGIILFGFSFTAGYFIVNLFHFHFLDYFLHLIETLFGFLVLGLIGFIIHLFTRTKQRYFFNEIIEALRKIAHGDFNVKLDFNINGRNDFTLLIDHINDMAKQLKQMEEMRQEFISNVSHEIQSPLTSIGGFARALQYDELTQDERKHYLTIIETECRRLSKLSDNLLKLTSLESEQQSFERIEYRLDHQIRNIILACEPNWTEKDIDMEASLDHVMVWADKDLMSQVWMNLLYNSIKFTPNSGKIYVRLQQVNGEAIIKICDTGIGISKGDQIHIFERFYKVDKARDRSKGGSGLGLSIVKKIIEMHEGNILVESEVGKGTTFTIKIPVREVKKEWKEKIK